ncbi:1-acyl-sn-glycerol-3-phosphate acyltransferases [Micromonospora phaseoli]|uniref:1-acyl-sn-glycerol-3-phosphate acyltransferases n=1 Tax=Micromonospora phaseoli TaxID=1144548 RepID=A0A1H6U120_9ACTN|nr:lysophospholipid acyltransferase family protein [Micromonospora phaseoli]PZV98827.1 1-acyl-sn-glycerol-3-phosphate acyltransferase [Micromonospora phaseoli]GIJ76422.1 1-acyl-sn-glycerol-3-phosphate acyltransferase [Micromonospora phaseoli]SEI86009.1 1-acyl-sn-glycerol-3-phosphate acyltransferases [Micromonospora phaseoli]
MDTAHSPWQPPLIWRTALLLARVLVGLLARLEVTGDIPARLRGGPLILAANHISPFDPVVLAAACRARRVAPRIMATGGLFRAPVIGAAMRSAGHIRVDRGTSGVHQALDDAASAVGAGAPILVYPEGRIGLDPGMWPERGKTGAARLALTCGAPVIPVAQWGSHEVLPYQAPKGLLRGVARALVRRPTVRVHFGDPVDLDDLTPGAPGAARRATDRIIDALTDTLAPLRPDEPDRPRHVDPGRPVDTSRAHRRRPAAG